MNVLKTTLATLALAAALPAHAGLPIGGTTAAIEGQVAWSPRAVDPFVASNVDANGSRDLQHTTIAGVAYDIRFASLPSGASATISGAADPTAHDKTMTSDAPSHMRLKALDPARASTHAVPDPGTLQVFGLGLVILATVAGTQRRKST